LELQQHKIELYLPATAKSELFSIGVIAYEMLTAKHPYPKLPEKQSKNYNINKIKYTSSTQYNPMIPVWIDGALKKAVHCDYRLRYDCFSEFLYDLQHPNEKFMLNNLPLLEKNQPKHGD